MSKKAQSIQDMDDEQVADLKEAFAMFDINGDGRFRSCWWPQLEDPFLALSMVSVWIILSGKKTNNTLPVETVPFYSHDMRSISDVGTEFAILLPACEIFQHLKKPFDAQPIRDSVPIESFCLALVGYIFSSTISLQWTYFSRNSFDWIIFTHFRNNRTPWIATGDAQTWSISHKEWIARNDPKCWW